MGKYSNLTTIATIPFSSPEWLAEDIVTMPSNFTGNVKNNEYIRIHVLTQTPFPEYSNLNQMVGQLIIDIFTPGGQGTIRAAQISDLLDLYLVGKTFQSGNATVQYGASISSGDTPDSVNAALSRRIYSIPLSYFES